MVGTRRETRTPMPSRAPVPETGVSTNSTSRAYGAQSESRTRIPAVGAGLSGRTTSEEGCSIPLPRFAQEPRKLHIRSLLLPSPHRTTLRWGPYTDVAQLADASDLRSEKLWVRGPPSVPLHVACSSVGRAPGCGPEGRRFESAHAPQTGP